MTDDPFQCRCVLCHDYGDREEADSMDLTIIDHVQQHGWHVAMVPEDEIGPGFAYTIGLAHTHGGPELAMFGLDVHAMLQVAWPDAKGRFHWDEQADARHRESQPQLWLPPSDHPVGIWTTEL